MVENNNHDDEKYLDGKITREELSERRRREQKRKEFEKDIGRDLSLEYEKVVSEEQQQGYRNKYIDTAINFFTTLVLLYMLLFGFKLFVLVIFEKILNYMGIATGWINPTLHVLAWTGALISVFRKRSVIENLIDFFH